MRDGALLKCEVRVRRSLYIGAVVCAVSFTAACSTSVTTLQSGRALAPGQVQFTGAMTVPVASETIGAVIDLGDQATKSIDAAAGGEALSEADQRDAVASALAIVLFQPAVVPEIIGRVGIVPNLELGLRASGQLIKGEVKYQVWDGGRDAGAFTLGYAHHFGPASSALSSVFGILEKVKLGDFSRGDLDLGFVLSRDWGEWLTLYGSARYIASFISLDANIEDVEAITGASIVSVDNTMHHFGVSGGMFIGYKHVFLNLELTVLGVLFSPELLGETQDLDGAIVAPTAGLTIKF